jgi:hypothetical protein
MFEESGLLKRVDLSNLNLDFARSFVDMFSSCSDL